MLIKLNVHTFTLNIILHENHHHQTPPPLPHQIRPHQHQTRAGPKPHGPECGRLPHQPQHTHLCPHGSRPNPNRRNPLRRLPSAHRTRVIRRHRQPARFAQRTCGGDLYVSAQISQAPKEKIGGWKIMPPLRGCRGQFSG